MTQNNPDLEYWKGITEQYIITTTDADIDAGYPEVRIQVLGRNALNAALEAANLGHYGTPLHRLSVFCVEDNNELREIGNAQELLNP